MTPPRVTFNGIPVVWDSERPNVVALIPTRQPAWVPPATRKDGA